MIGEIILCGGIQELIAERGESVCDGLSDGFDGESVDASDGLFRGSVVEIPEYCGEIIFEIDIERVIFFAAVSLGFRFMFFERAACFHGFESLILTLSLHHEEPPEHKVRRSLLCPLAMVQKENAN